MVVLIWHSLVWAGCLCMLLCQVSCLLQGLSGALPGQTQITSQRQCSSGGTCTRHICMNRQESEVSPGNEVQQVIGVVPMGLMGSGRVDHKPHAMGCICASEVAKPCTRTAPSRPHSCQWGPQNTPEALSVCRMRLSTCVRGAPTLRMPLSYSPRDLAANTVASNTACSQQHDSRKHIQPTAQAETAAKASSRNHSP